MTPAQTRAHTPPPARRWLLPLATTAALLLPTACKKTAGDEEATVAASVAVTAAHPTVGPIAEEIASDALLAPLAQAAIAPRISAPIRKLYVQRGSRVRAGQLLLTLEDRDLRGSALDSQGNFKQAHATYTAAIHATIPEEVQKAQLDVDQSKANLDVATRTAAERKRLFAQGAIAGRDVDTAVAAAVVAQAAFDIAAKHLKSVLETTRTSSTETAQGQLTSAEGKLASAEAQVSYASLRSPINGVVTDRPFFAGETAPAGSAVITVMDTSALLAKLHLSQAAAQKLTLGGEAEITVPGVPEALPAKVSLISPALDPGSTTVEVWLRLANADGRFKSGTPVHTVIAGTAVPGALQIPASALLSAESGFSVMVVGADGAAHKRPVEIGIRTPEKVQITSGLSAADTVITEGSYGLDDGTKVTLNSAAKPAEGKD